MALEIRHTRAEHTHENEQFRRIAKVMKVLFDKMKWDGLLIGNPFTYDFSRFRADALLFYTNGIIVIDLKDYTGEIKLPTTFAELKDCQWYIENTTDKRRTLVKGGSYKNPFAQLNTYRGTLKELIKSNLVLSKSIKGEKMCIVNIFRTPIKLINEVPRDVPYYKITDENTFQSLLCDFVSNDKFSTETAEEFKRIFPSEPWIELFDLNIAPKENTPFLELVDDNFKTVISDYINHPEQKILILESGDTKKRDEWMQYVLSESTSFDIPQTEVWVHSTRIAKRIKSRIGIEPQSLFSTIYGGNVDNPNDVESTEDEKEENSDAAQDKIPEQIQNTVGIRSDKELDNKCLIVLCEAHLVTRSIFQTELLRFGSGRLLEDLFKHIKLTETNRKLIFIGDPYSLSYGKEDESALSIETIAQLYEGEVLMYRDKFEDTHESAINKLRGHIITSLDQRQYNNLQLVWDNATLEEVDKQQTEKLLYSWFKNSDGKEPEKAVLVFTNKDALKISRWVRKHVQNKQEDFVQGDVLLVDNNFNIPDELGVAQPQRIQNGMYLQIEEKLEGYQETIPIKGQLPVTLKFIKLRVACISLKPQCNAEIWILENFFANSNELTLEEQIAYRIFVSQRISKRFKFIESPFYKKFQGSTEYQTLIAEQNKLQISVNSGGKVKTELKGITSKINKLEKREKKRFDHDSFLQVMNSDPLVNAAFVQYAYAMTVHKAIGSSFSEILFNNFQGENRGVTNENYFRWLYTGITCGLDSVKIINPVSINPLMNCIFEDIMSITSPFPSLANKKNAINFPEIQIDKIFQKYSDYELPENIKRGGTFLINSLQPQGYIAETISTASYLMKIIFTTPLGNELDAKEKLHIVMHYNGKKEVSVIKIEKAGKSDSELIGECISKITGNAETDHYSIPLPNDFRNQVYKNWMETCASEGFQLKLMEEHPYQSVFKIKKGGILGSFRIYYTNEGFFTKLAMIEKSVDELGTEIKKMLLNGSQA